MPHLAESFSWFLDKRLQTIAILPAAGQSARWTPRVLDTLERELTKVYRLTRRHYDDAGDVPLLAFRKTADDAPAARGAICGAAGSGSMTVDVDGEVYACPMLAESRQRFANARLAAAVQPMRIGHVASRAFWRRLDALPARAEERGLFHIGPGRHSRHGQCIRCPHHLECKACPVAVLSEPAHDDAQRVPDYLCAFNWTLLAAAGARQQMRTSR